MNKVTVIGSINLDRTIRVKEMAKPGETIHASEVFSAGGGKGANQAVAAKRSGAKTAFIGAVGNDDAGKTMRELLGYEEIQLDGIAELDKVATGQAYIVVDEKGENSIMIHAGANGKITPEHVVEHADLIKESDFVIAQFESDLASTIKAFEVAHQAGVKTILNPAPAMRTVPEELLKTTDVIAPNETETEILTGIKVVDEESMRKAAAKLHALGIKVVLITIGSKGSFYSMDGQSGIVPAFKVKAVDTTAAGDTFIGALSTVLKPDFSNLVEAITYGNKASSLTVQRFGAQPSIPYKHELN
ncbi:MULTISPECIES: ribokinase [Ligilactobacillus]|uniref:Ribokinase n=1 Tax=Ligilactobacillus animalis TaxID=1605 RepID=A0AAJ6FY39_9LACO|nr:ribokinase [Ligilactobacillus animalis]KDA46753.1 ribokinase, rbsK [Ligilactobacillus animalis]MBU5279759.1 ribokinase [Ligilactobacillus animalis]MDO5883339.1 ribokinase [Ligilactobacillus animalis]MDQ2233524.1 ribokinase [Ligilactobacillus animalis]MDU1487130.1 ribokinase [Ligilactobacillus animalis]